MSSNAAPTKRVPQVVLVVCTLGTSWLGMQAVHELGHLVGAWMSQATVERVVLHPLSISRTDVGHNPQPLLVVWAGPILGCDIPFITWLVSCWVSWSSAFLLRFFAGFCLVANGLYIGFGSLDRVGDCGEMLRHGSPHWTLWLFGSTMAPAGLWLWNGQSRYFGWGVDSAMVDRRAVRVSVAAFVSLIALGLLIGDR